MVDDAKPGRRASDDGAIRDGGGGGGAGAGAGDAPIRAPTPTHARSSSIGSEYPAMWDVFGVRPRSPGFGISANGGGKDGK
jgi:hypothetical protein